MNISEYIEKLRAKPVRERERIAVVATIIGFFIFVGIWIVSFREMNKATEQPVDQTSASLNDLKNNFQDGKDSIQDMMQQLPSQTAPAGETGSVSTDAADGNSAEGAVPTPDATIQNPVDNTGNNDQNKNSVPALP